MPWKQGPSLAGSSLARLACLTRSSEVLLSLSSQYQDYNNPTSGLKSFHVFWGSSSGPCAKCSAD